MVFINYDLMSIFDDEYNLNSYFILNSNGDFCFIDQTLENYKKVEKKFNLKEQEELNFFFTNEKPIDIENLLEYLENNYNNSKITIYINSSDYFSKNTENITFINDFKRIEVGFIVLNRIELPGITKNAIGLKYKECVFTGQAISTDFNYFQIEDETKWTESFEWFKKEIPDSFLICSSYGEQMKKSHWMLKLKKRG